MDNRERLPTPPLRLWSLDALRGVCAGIVFLSHWHLWSDFPPRGAVERLIRSAADFCHQAVTTLTWPTGGHHPAVIGFFVLSGFCIHYPFERRLLAGEARPDWNDYFRRRFLRIMPVYWAACALGLLFVAAEHLRPSGSLLLGLHSANSVEHTFVRLSGLAGVYPREIFAGNYILTTVTVEIFMYAAYPLFYGAAARGAWKQLGTVFVALHLFAIALLPFFTPYWVFNSIFMLGLFWYAGAFAAHVYLTRRPRISASWLFLAWLVFLGLKFMPHFTGLNLLKQLGWGVVCAVGILWTVQLETTRPQAVHGKMTGLLRHVGGISYSLYAMHTPAIMLATWALLHLGWKSYSLQLIATMTTSLLATYAVHFGIERPFYRPRAPISTERPQNETAAAAPQTLAR